MPRPPWRGRAGAELRRPKSSDLRRLHRWLASKGWRDRRTHDLRRTWISLALSDGVDREALRWASHGRPGDVMGLYTEPEWARLCAELGKLKVPAAARRVVVRMTKGDRR